jgi:hypothetical protein
MSTKPWSSTATQGPRRQRIGTRSFEGQAREVTLKCRNGLYTFGAGLPDEEVGYLYLIVQRAFAGMGGTD